MEVTGNLIKKLDIQKGISKAGKEWQKMSFVIETDSKYNNQICFDLFGEEKIAMLDQEIGSELKVYFNLSSREFNGRYYTQAQAWKIENLNNNISVNSEEDDFLQSIAEADFKGDSPF